MRVTSPRAALPLLALAAFAAPAAAQSSAIPDVRWGIGAVATMGAGTSAGLLGSGVGAEGFYVLTREGPWAARIEGLAASGSSVFARDACPAQIGTSGCERRWAQGVVLAGVSAIYGGDRRDGHATPYAILTLGRYLSWWGGGVFTPGAAGDTARMGSGSGPSGTTLGAGAGIGIGKRYPVRFEVRGIQLRSFAGHSPVLVTAGVGLTR
jgi:hypothetical protein